LFVAKVSFLLLGLALLAAPAHADDARQEIPSAFFIAKSENKNQVHFAVAVDSKCAPLGDAPVRPYWLMLEKGPAVTEPLLAREQGPYGLASQQVLTRTADGGSVRVTLKAVPARPVTIETMRESDGTCSYHTHMTIASKAGRLQYVYVKLAFVSIDYLLLVGKDDEGGELKERIDP
jgi:hypothetical protein